MSLAIDVERVAAVLLSDGDWHLVEGTSFHIDAYEYTCDGELRHGGGENGICAAGFSFKTKAGNYVSGPLSSVVAVRCLRDEKTGESVGRYPWPKAKKINGPV